MLVVHEYANSDQVVYVRIPHLSPPCKGGRGSRNPPESAKALWHMCVSVMYRTPSGYSCLRTAIEFPIWWALEVVKSRVEA